MNFPAVLSIDFGSTYTKVGYRREMLQTKLGQHEETAQSMLMDELALVPTLAIATGRQDKPWVFGPEAAGLNPGEAMEVFTNWKASLFKRDNNATTARSIIIAEAFFRWLKDRIETAMPDMQHLHVRVMVPAFDDFEQLADVMRQCMKLAGWKMKIEVCTEPHANALGLMTRGKNHYNIGTKSRGVDFMRMYGFNSSLIQGARKLALSNNTPSHELRVAILDVGSFTTDLAVLIFSLEANAVGDGLKKISQKSYEIGAHTYLTEPLWKQLGEKYSANFSAASFQFKEEIKRTIFAREPYAIMFGTQRREIGGEHDAAIIDKLIEDFALAIWRQVAQPLNDGRVSVVYLTGGGSQVPMLVEQLQKLGACFAPVSSPVAPPIESDKKQVHFVPWTQGGEKLERIATAIGGCGIIPPVVLREAPIGVPQFPSNAKQQPSSSFRSCSCGGNPDCKKCEGTGYIA